jgi:hypothetical protein
MKEFSFEELSNCMSIIQKNTCCTAQEMGIGIKKFGKILEDFNQLTNEEKARFWIDVFSNIDNKEACEEFARRHPNCSLNAFIPKD